MDQSTTDPTATLTAAAFGANPQVWPLPTVVDPRDRWLRAVAAGGQGHYAVALSELDVMTRDRSSGPLVSLAHSTRASFLRQLGGHRAAAGWDGRALAEAGTDPHARADALVGLAADALGVGRLAMSARLLSVAADVSDTGRGAVRLHWVSAELAMAGGDGAAALTHAERAVASADTLGSVRHCAKSQVVLAAALCCAGDLDRSRRVADAAFTATAESGLVPLHWALACLLADIGSAAHPGAAVRAARDEAADTVRRRGGVWSRR
ncbi:hypothetical protein ACWDUN_20115 [Mycobacterium sp. NPDC003323]